MWSVEGKNKQFVSNYVKKKTAVAEKIMLIKKAKHFTKIWQKFKIHLKVMKHLIRIQGIFYYHQLWMKCFAIHDLNLDFFIHIYTTKEFVKIAQNEVISLIYDYITFHSVPVGTWPCFNALIRFISSLCTTNTFEKVM